LLVEDSEDDALLVLRELRKGGYDPQLHRVQSAAVFRQALAEQQWDIIIADYSLPGFNGFAALDILHETRADIPFIIVSGAIGEDQAVKGMKAGAHDYILKDNLSRLAPAVERELREAADRHDRRRMEAALRESEQRTKLHFLRTPLGVIDWNLNFQVVAWNPAAEEIFGYSASEAQGRHGSFLVPPELHGKIEETWRQLLSAQGGERTSNACVTRTGQTIFCEWFNTPLIDERGHVMGVASLVRDITPQRLAEDAFRSLIKGTSTVGEPFFRALVKEMAGALGMRIALVGQLVSPSARRIRTVAVWDRDHPGENFEYSLEDAPCGDVMEKKLCIFSGDVQSRFPKDALLHQMGVISYAGAPLFDSKGELLGLLAVLGDHPIPQTELLRSVLTIFAARAGSELERVNSDNALRHMEEQLRHSQKMEAIGTLAGGIAHDFNNILASIIPNTHLAIEDAGDNPAVRESLDQVLVAADRARNLVQQILAFSRRQQQEKRPIDLGPIVRETLELIRSALPSTIAISTHIASDVPPVLGDPTQIHQVLMNLCTNAEHAMRQKGGCLDVSLTCRQISRADAASNPDLNPGPHASLVVNDTGSGIAEDMIKRVFEPFFTTKAPGEGTGLGLSVVHGIVKDHNGAILLNSVPNKGTRFEILLPACEDKRTRDVPDKTRTVRGNGEHVLLVDDEEALCVVVSRILKRCGYTVTTHANPLAALNDFRSDPSRFHAVFTDFTMPGMTGVALAAEIHAIRPDLPIIMATGLGSATSQESHPGIRRTVCKPVDFHTVAQIMDEVLHHQEDVIK
jgi:PAS domain S-box-containing protein